jgi:hypothetical protein
MVNPANLLSTCQNCHPGVGPNWTGAWTGHNQISLERTPFVYYTDVFYSISLRSSLGSVICGIEDHPRPGRKDEDEPEMRQSNTPSRQIPLPCGLKSILNASRLGNAEHAILLLSVTICC